MNETANIFGIPIEGESLERVMDRLILRDPSAPPLWIVTANPEILLEARKNRDYASVLKSANVKTVDGFGLWLILRLFSHKTERVTGVDLSERVVQYACQKGWRIGLVGGAPGIAEKAAHQIEVTLPQVQILAHEGGRVVQDGSDDEKGASDRASMKSFDPHILLVAFGHPKQEMWISKHRHDFPSLKMVIGVGGTFDYWAGARHRAPAFLQSIGLEWLWRLMVEPSRWRRILNAVFVFPVLATHDIIKRRNTL